MNDLGSIPLSLIQQKVARPVDPEQLELMGKQAAKLYQECGTKLNEAVVQIVKEARLAPEQVKRVCEFANTSAYLEEFEKAGEMRNITFSGGPANPGTVLKDLNDGSAPAIHQVDEDDYSSPAGHYKTAGSNGDDVLAAAFGVGSGMEKAASAITDHGSHASPIDDLNDMRLALTSIRDDFKSKLSSAHISFDEIEVDLTKTAEQSVMDGMPLGDMRRAWMQTDNTEYFVKKAMVVIGKYLLEQRGYSQEDLGTSFRKTASGGLVANAEHPLMSKFAAYAALGRQVMMMENAATIANEELTRVSSQLQRLVA